MLKATVYMLNGDIYELPHGDELFKFLVGPPESVESLANETPFYTTSGEKERVFTLKHDGFFITINRDAISHVEWGDINGTGMGVKKRNTVEISLRESDKEDFENFVRNVQRSFAQIAGAL